MPFFRRQFGGYSARDLPPPPHNFWPTCMSVQTYFRDAANPYSPILYSKLESMSLFTFYAVQEPILLRKVCQGTPTVPHAYMQDLLLQLGTPATEFKGCWDQYWSLGQTAPIGTPTCNSGEFPTTEAAVVNAACAVKEARVVTDAMLPAAP